ncbi:MAG: L-rhamnose mutarotase [Asticcacaulis sp.]|nr:L-rhamnose mutarotase [Asticcacaulis sp.]
MSHPVVYCLDLKDDAETIAAYRKWHAPGAVPAAVTHSIRAAGIDALEIFLAGNRLVMLLTPGPDFDPVKKAAADAGDPEVQAWEKLMWDFQQAVPFAAPGQKWVPMDKIYALSDQP